MRYGQMSAAAVKRLTVPRLDGGLNQSGAAHRIADNQLADGVNLWWQEGALRTRPGFQTGLTPWRPAGEGVTRLFSREDGSDREMRERQPVRRFVERRGLAGGAASYVVGTLYADGTVRTSGAVTLTGPDSGPFANDHGLVVDWWEAPLVFFGCGKVYRLEAGSLTDIGGEIPIPRLLIGGRGVPSPSSEPVIQTGVGESRNLLTPKFRAVYTTDGKCSAFYLPLQGLDNAPVTAALTLAAGTVTHTVPAGASAGGLGADGYRLHLDRARGCVWFTDAAGNAAMPPFRQANNLDITASKADETGRDRIFGMTFSTWFGGDPTNMGGGTRLFLGGNPRCPGRVYWSQFNTPLYFPEYNYSVVGREDELVTAFGHQGDNLVLFKEREVYAVNYVQRPLDAEKITDLTTLGAYFPVTQLHSSIGCGAPGTVTLCGGRLVWADRGRVYMLSGVDAYSRANVRKLSAPVEKALAAFAPADWREASAGVYAGRYVLLVGGSFFLLPAEEGVLRRLAGTAGETAAQSLLNWSRWEPPEGARPLWLTAREESAALLAEAALPGGAVALGMCLDGDDDRVPLTVDGETVERPVAWLAATKAFDCGAPDRRKAFLSVRAGLVVDNLRPAMAAYVTEDGVCPDPVLLPPEGGWLRRIPGAARARRLGLRLEGTGTVEIDGVTLLYRLLG